MSARVVSRWLCPTPFWRRRRALQAPALPGLLARAGVALDPARAQAAGSDCRAGAVGGGGSGGTGFAGGLAMRPAKRTLAVQVNVYVGPADRRRKAEEEN